MSQSFINYLRFCTGESIDEILSKTSYLHSISISRKELSESSERDNTKECVFRNISRLLSYNDYQLEADHSFIQWMFPTPRGSQFNGNAPLISKQEINILKKIPAIRNMLILFKNKMFEYWGLQPYSSENIRRLNGHNGLRLSRAIECLTLFYIDVTDCFDILKQNIDNGLLRPFCEMYDYGKGPQQIPVWFIRYYENKV